MSLGTPINIDMTAVIGMMNVKAQILQLIHSLYPFPCCSFFLVLGVYAVPLLLGLLQIFFSVPIALWSISLGTPIGPRTLLADYPD